ncbi:MULTISPECIES: thioredoxin family protein [Calditerrivibrio]|jgi:thioredoxin 1|uniref:Thioredoxin n=1 Tax=Calditerrivibrio nitroreducens TaxID=477976 RepID=A0A2J6WJK8_9BACT|nr:MAG: thioredoxin [Calditerrivibrio nitroreducens]
MKNKFILLFSFVLLLFIGCSKEKSISENVSDVKNGSDSHLITFIELGSVNCVPCKMMQPVMKNIEKRFGSQVKVIFYDVWTKEQEGYAKIYNINGIPTQVFLDKNGNEIARHVGFYPEEELADFLKSRGLKEIGTK